jgi:hypothetical protein
MWWILLLTGCDHQLDSIEGYDLGRPETVVWSKDDESGRVMVVASDLNDLCDVLDTGEWPSPPYWALWTWSETEASYESELDAEAFASIQDGILDDTFEGGGVMVLDDGDKALDVHIDVEFGADRILADLQADNCDADLFNTGTADR